MASRTLETAHSQADQALRPLDPDEFGALEGMARSLTASGWYRVVRRFQRRGGYALDDGQSKRLALFVDVETTGRDASRDQVIEVGAVLFEYGPNDGRIYSLLDSFSALEDPGSPLPAEVTAITGITDEMVRGRRIEDAPLISLVERAALLIAHNARFDRGFLERRLPVFGSKPWACSMADVPWRELGCANASLEYLLYRHCAEFFNAHRALEDCLVGVHVVATPASNGALPFAFLLESARRPMVRVWARGSSYEARGVLKARGYQWYGGESGGSKSWYIDIAKDGVPAEREWLQQNAYVGPATAIAVEAIPPHRRFAQMV